MNKNNKFAVIGIGGKQYKIYEGDEVLISKMNNQKPEPEVLLFVYDDKFILGKPLVKDITVKLKVLGEEKGEKIKIFKYKAKSRYRKSMGFRPKFTKILVEKIG